MRIFVFILCFVLCQASHAAPNQSLRQAIQAAQNKDYVKASALFYKISNDPSYSKKKGQVKYLLGLMLYQMGLYQLATYQFVPIIKSTQKGATFQKSLEKMAIIADKLEDDSILNYAMSKVVISKFPKNLHNLLFFRIGQFQMRNQQHEDAIRSLRRVSQKSDYYGRAKYSEALAFAEIQKPQKAIKSFEKLYASRAEFSKKDPLKIAAVMGKARALYQAGRWNEASLNYKDIAKDSSLWHSTLLEGGWSFLRGGKFRSALSNFLTLHSPFYENFYLPESLLLRSIVYLYICQHQDAEKVLKVFEKDYKKIYNEINLYLKREKTLVNYYKFIEKSMTGQQADSKNKMPLKIALNISQKGDFLRAHNYVGKLIDEIEKVKNLPRAWSNSSLGRYSRAVLKRRLQRAQIRAGRVIQAHMLSSKAELEDLFEQEELIKFEIIKSKRRQLSLEKEVKTSQAIDSSRNRDFYVQNGYDYWPFEGEYWLDELGAYYYLGTHSCRDF